MIRFIKKTVDVVFILLLMLILAVMSVSSAETVFSGFTAFAAGMIILAAVFAFLHFFKEKLQTCGRYIYKCLSGISGWKLSLILGLFSVVTKIVFVFLFDNNADLHPDMAMYRSFAQQFAESGKIVENAGYAFEYRYTAMYGLVLSPFAKIFGADTKVFTTALSVMNSVAVVLIFDIIKKYAGKAISFFILIIYCALPFGLFQTQLLTHENGLFFFHLLALWLFLKAFEKQKSISKQIAFLLLSSVVLSIGASINAAGRVMLISFAIYAFAKIFENGFSAKKAGQFLCVALSLIVIFSSALAVTGSVVKNNIAQSETMQKNEKRMPYAWALYLGLNYEESGLWNQEDVDTYSKYKEFETKDEAYEYQKQLIKERFEFLTESPVRIPVHFFNKLNVLWGTQLLPFAYEIGNSINDFVLHGAGGIINKGFRLLNGTAFLIAYATVFMAQIKNIKKKMEDADPQMHFKMCVIGVTAVLLLFEVTPKYATHLHILLFCILAMSLKTFFSVNKTKKSVS